MITTASLNKRQRRPGRRARRVTIPDELLKLMALLAPVDGKGRFLVEIFPARPVNTRNHLEFAQHIVDSVPDEKQLERIKRQFVADRDQTRCGQINRVKYMHREAVKVIKRAAWQQQRKASVAMEGASE